MAFPLLGLLALGGGALGQDWYYENRAKRFEEKIGGLLGRAPDPTPDGGYSNPDPGAGLMANPADPQRQLEFMRGVMGLPRREREGAAQLFEGIMGRATQGALTREGWTRQEAMQREQEANTERRYGRTEDRITNQFNSSHQLLQDQFAENKRQFGENKAFDIFKFQQQNLLAWREDARAAAAAAQGQVPKLDLPPGYVGMMVPGEGGGPPKLVARPLEGTPAWEKAQEGMDAITAARANIALYLADIQKGFGVTREAAGRQRELYGRVRDSVRVLSNTGVLNVGEVPLLKEELPDPTEWFTASTTSKARITGQLQALDASFGRQEKLRQERYRGWGLRVTPLIPPPAPGQEGREKPPEGSVEIGGGGARRYGGRGGSQ